MKLVVPFLCTENVSFVLFYLLKHFLSTVVWRELIDAGDNLFSK